MTWPDSRRHSATRTPRSPGSESSFASSDDERPGAAWLHAPNEARDRNCAADRQAERLTAPVEASTNSPRCSNNAAGPVVVCVWRQWSTAHRGVTLAAVPDVPLLSLDSISKSGGAKVVLDDVTLALAPGTLTWLSGANGAGKTTLLRIAAGLLGPGPRKRDLRRSPSASQPP